MTYLEGIILFFQFSAYLTPLEAMSSVIAAVAHDLDHPGVTQAFLVATSNHLVNLYHVSKLNKGN